MSRECLGLGEARESGAMDRLDGKAVSVQQIVWDNDKSKRING